MNESSTQAPTSNFIVVMHGRGVLYTCLAKGDLDSVAEQCQRLCDSGFEVHIYSLKPNAKGKPSEIPAVFTLLQQEWQLWDATEEFTDLTNSIINHTDEHTLGGTLRYLDQCIQQLTDHRERVQEATRALTPASGGEASNTPTITGGTNATETLPG